MCGSRHRWVGAALLLLAGAAGCAFGRGREGATDAVSQTEWSLTVTNRHWLDVDIHVITDGLRAHVGSVRAVAAATYVLPPRLVGAGRSVRFEARAVGSPARATSEALVVRPGQHVEWTLQSGLDRSSIAIW